MRNTMFSPALMDEVMAHSFYSPEDEVGYDQQSKLNALSISHSLRGDSQQELGDRSSACVSPNPDLHGKGQIPPQQRRRIQVACSRCRKRKIKCSGDTSDGQGCSNCRSSGNPNCQFLRVNSSMLAPSVTGWPYPTTIPSQRAGLYTPSMTPKPVAGVLPANSPNFRAASLPRSTPTYDLGANDPQQPYSRQPYGVDPTINYDEETSSVYHSQSPAYMIPNTPVVMADYCGFPWHKAWSPSPIIPNRPHCSGGFPDHVIEHQAMSQSPFPYMVPGQGNQTTEPPIGPLIPISFEGQGADRILPNPTSRSQLQMGISSFPASPEAISGLPHPQDYRTSHPWPSKGNTLHNNARSSMQPVSNVAFSPSSTSRTKPHSPNPHDMVFGLMPMTSAGTPPPLISSSGAFNTLDTGDSGDEFRDNGDSRLTRTFPRNHGRHLSLAECSTETYGYCSTERSKKFSEASAATLVSGLPYTRPKPMGSLETLPVSVPMVSSLFPTDVMAEYRVSTEAHRAPISALSNPDGY